MRVLTWNLMHGRAVPPAGRELFGEFATALARWDWDAALLQEVPPWWPPVLGRSLGAGDWSVLTSRNSLLPLRQAVARRWPDLIKSNGGGANAVLVRRLGVVEHRWFRLCVLPERRWVHAVRLDEGLWVGNVHTGPAGARGGGGGALGGGGGGGMPVVFGGDFNVASLSLDRFLLAGANGVDQVFVTGGLSVTGAARVLERGLLSDHAPLVVSVGRRSE
jgi:endonuclease/exonuclease/phosphatase family metal-dependent hydrolase